MAFNSLHENLSSGWMAKGENIEHDSGYFNDTTNCMNTIASVTWLETVAHPPESRMGIKRQGINVKWDAMVWEIWKQLLKLNFFYMNKTFRYLKSNQDLANGYLLFRRKKQPDFQNTKGDTRGHVP